LTLVIQDQEKNPRRAEEEDYSIQYQKRGYTGFFVILTHVIKPKKLGQKNKRDGTVARVE
jgi:hypothetical protein